MKMKVIIGSAAAMGLLGVGVLAGSVVGPSYTAAQTPAQTATAEPSTPNSGVVPPAVVPKDGLPFSGRHGYGPGHGGFGKHGRGGGHFFHEATADTAAAHISSVSDLIDLVKQDLAYATGKMDTADAQRWVNEAGSLLQSAQAANTGSKYEQAIAYAQAAGELAMTAQMQMAQALGADTLPSYSQHPMRGKHMMPANGSTTITQAQASRILADTYNRLIATGATLGSATSSYLTDAQAAYSDAYNAYQQGNYAEAATFSHLAGQLAGVASTVNRATTSPGNSDTPVAVPAPTF